MGQVKWAKADAAEAAHKELPMDKLNNYFIVYSG